MCYDGDIHGIQYRERKKKSLISCISQVGKLSTVQAKKHTQSVEMSKADEVLAVWVLLL